MSITKILERHQTLMAEASKALDVKAPTADMVQLPLRHQEQRIERLKHRIDGLEQAKREYGARIDSEVATVRAELAGAQKRLDESRKILATAEERPAPRSPKEPPQTPRDGSKKSQRRAKK
jgi:DNA repair ATPase RecN